jgi:hypothetical protein
VQGQAGFIYVAKRKQQKRPRQADAFLYIGLLCRFDHLLSAQCAREVSQDQLPR